MVKNENLEERNPNKVTIFMDFVKKQKEIMVLDSVTHGTLKETKQGQKLKQTPQDYARVGPKKRLSESKNSKIIRYTRRPINGRVRDNMDTALAVGKRSSILLVEDAEFNRALARRLMKEFSVGFEEAKNGKEAVDLIEKGRIYDLILMDRDMPVMDGHEATRKLRLLGVKTPIIALSSDSLQSDQDLFIQAGATEFEPKPLSRDKLVRILTKYSMDLGNY